MTETPPPRRVIKLDEQYIGHGEAPRLHKVATPKKVNDYPEVSRFHLEVAKHYTNPLLVGPPLCDELVALVRHMLTEEEASVMRHIKSLRGKTAQAVAAAAHRPIDEVRPILERLAGKKFILIGSGNGEKKRYSLMPLLPGVFELVMLQPAGVMHSEWQRRFAELFMSLYDTGYLADYFRYPAMGVRYVPVGQSIETCQRALPADRLEEVFDRYKTFAVGVCDCRTSERIVGRGCGRPVDTCIGFGEMAEFLIRHDKMRRVEKREVLEIKAEAAAAGLASFIVEMKLGGTVGGASCSCCGCCCAALRMINQFDTPGIVAPPHYLPRVDLAQCVYCGRCARVCPVGAIVVDVKNKTYLHKPERCIGCGLCAVACDGRHAVHMEPVVRHIRLSEGKIGRLLMTANHLRNIWSVWRKR